LSPGTQLDATTPQDHRAVSESEATPQV
jgi:hypothetical protein